MPHVCLPLADVGGWNYTYDANDRITGFAAPAYDNDGNIAWQAGTQESYDYESHLVGSGGITYQYDGDGNRVSKTMAGGDDEIVYTYAHLPSTPLLLPLTLKPSPRYFLRLRKTTSNDSTPVWSRTPTRETLLSTLYSN